MRSPPPDRDRAPNPEPKTPAQNSELHVRSHRVESAAAVPISVGSHAPGRRVTGTVTGTIRVRVSHVPVLRPRAEPLSGSAGCWPGTTAVCHSLAAPGRDSGLTPSMLCTAVMPGRLDQQHRLSGLHSTLPSLGPPRAGRPITDSEVQVKTVTGNDSEHGPAPKLW